MKRQFENIRTLQTNDIKGDRGGGGMGEGGGWWWWCKVTLELSRHLRILLLIAGLEIGKSLESSFHNLFKNTTFRYLRGADKTLS